jgi:LysM repeat protein
MLRGPQAGGNESDAIHSGGDCMEWKDSGEKTEQGEQEEYFDEEEYSPWAEGKNRNNVNKTKKPPLLFILFAVAIVALVAVLLMLLSGERNPLAQQKLNALEGRIMALEDRLDKYEAIDEKVTRIWEQAKSFEKFKDRFDRSEASTSLRMDHLTMSLETMQKQLNTSKKRTRSPAAGAVPAKTTAAPTPGSKIKFHQVKAGETLYSISKIYGLKVEELLKLNRMKSGSMIVAGQKLVVPNTAN